MDDLQDMEQAEREIEEIQEIRQTETDFEEMDLSSSSSNDLIYIPQVRIEKIPKLDQEFESLEEAHTFYNDYAREAGFSIRMSCFKKNRSHEIIRREYVCHKQGVRESVELNIERSRKRGITREGCKAKMAVLMSSSKKTFKVSIFHEAHNHVLTTPRKVHLLRSHRFMSAAKKSLTQQLSAANVPICQQIGILDLESGGIENIGCIEKDFYNARRDEMKLYAGHDGQMLYEYFQSEKEKNPDFFFVIKMDTESKITHCFWADVECRKSYHAFGDVVVFDTTYNTNRYGMIFAPFVGVNHHGQTTLFASAFLKDETTESFLWLLQQLLSCMSVGPPKMIITDQDPAMTKAIAELLPNTVHRYCMWHILMKFSEKIDAVKLRDHYTQFQQCIWRAETPVQFETEWNELLEQSGLLSNDWLRNLYEIRFKWIPAYVDDTFSAGMSSSQRAESCHAFFKSYVSKKNTLMDFVVRFSRAQKHLRHQELCLDHKDINEQPIMKSMWCLEKSMAELYTHNIFYKVQEEFCQSQVYMGIVENETDYMCTYHVKRVDRSQSRIRTVIENKSINRMTCSCRKFESYGILCRHIFAAFPKMQLYNSLPDMYVLRRWTKSAKCIASSSLGSTVGDGHIHHNIVMQHNKLRMLASSVVDAGLVNAETYKFASKMLESIHCELKTMTLSDTGQFSAPIDVSKRLYNEPEQVRAKGCGKRIKGGKEIATKNKNKRRCNGCGLDGQDHDKRNCPYLNSINGGT